MLTAPRALMALALTAVMAGGIAASSASNEDIGAPTPAAHAASAESHAVGNASVASVIE
jgi:hypothetical protein